MLGFGAIGEAPTGPGGDGSLDIRKEIEKPQDIRSDGSVDETMPVTTADAAPDDHDALPARRMYARCRTGCSGRTSSRNAKPVRLMACPSRSRNGIE
jgi:hypothetical protein